MLPLHACCPFSGLVTKKETSAVLGRGGMSPGFTVTVSKIQYISPPNSLISKICLELGALLTFAIVELRDFEMLLIDRTSRRAVGGHAENVNSRNERRQEKCVQNIANHFHLTMLSN